MKIILIELNFQKNIKKILEITKFEKNLDSRRQTKTLLINLLIVFHLQLIQCLFLMMDHNLLKYCRYGSRYFIKIFIETDRPQEEEM